MRHLELRRHSIRTAGEEHLSQEGVTLARRIGESTGPFWRVISSPAARCIETAVAMGFALDEIYYPVSLTQVEWAILAGLIPLDSDFAHVTQVLRENALGRRYADLLRAAWIAYAAAVPDGRAALVITHGGYIDASAVACLPEEDHRTWGECFDRCEGIRLAYNGTAFVSGEQLRVPKNGV